MFVDARQLPAQSKIEADICIIGAGPAGITLARDLAAGHRRVAVFESGGFEFDAETQKLYTGQVVGHPYTPLAADRLRYLGGSSNHWAGSCRPFDAADLAEWPFGLEVLESYYRRAQSVCQLGPYDYDPHSWSSDTAAPLAMASDSPLRNGVFQYSPPTRFGVAYRNDLSTSAGLTVYLNANLVQIDANEAAGAVTGVALACLDGKRFSARANHYVLAAGGIENARLLLNCDQVQKTGLGNQFDLVGRYFADHPYVPGGATILADGAQPEMLFYDQHLARGQRVEGYFYAAEELRKREGLPPFAIGIRPVGGESKDTGVGDVPIPRLLNDALSESQANALRFYLAIGLNRLTSPAHWIYDRMWKAPPGSFITLYNCGTEPDPQSRVTLDETRDALGLRESRLDWRLPSDFEKKMQRAHELLGQALGRSGAGRLRIESAATTGFDPMQYLGNGHHHMGTTRMHTDPRQGVVDVDCRVHGIANLYIAGSSVFPTYACDDPTMTIVALALRLSDHLKSLPSGGV
jgi:choline dehydrogenase-like flavoprotein